MRAKHHFGRLGPIAAVILVIVAGATYAVRSETRTGDTTISRRAPLSTDGARIVDREGQEFVIRGVNWFGFETASHIVHGLWVRDYRDMLAQIRSLGFNAIRLPFSLEALQSSSFTGVTFSDKKNASLKDKTPLAAMDLIVEEAAKHGLFVLLDNHSLVDDDFGYDLWYGRGGFSEDDWVANWTTLARRYRDEPNVLGADLKNEPHGRATWGDGGATDWRRAAEVAGNAILAVAPHWLIFVEGIEGPVPGQRLSGHWQGGNLEAVEQFPVRLRNPRAVVYSPHEYGPGVFNHPWFADPNRSELLVHRWKEGFQYIAEQGIAPVVIGEFGGRDTSHGTAEGDWQRQFVNFLAASSHGWFYWAWNPNSADTGGILNDDWITVNKPKMDLLRQLTSH